MSAPLRAAAWTALLLTAVMGLVWGWLPSADLGFDPVTSADRATSAGAYLATVLVLLATLHVLDRHDAPRRLRLATTLTAVAFTVLVGATALDLDGLSLTSAYADLKAGATGVLLTPWALGLVALATIGLISPRPVAAEAPLAPVVPLRRSTPTAGTGTA